jgi:hypothetical protein
LFEWLRSCGNDVLAPLVGQGTRGSDAARARCDPQQMAAQGAT